MKTKKYILVVSLFLLWTMLFSCKKENSNEVQPMAHYELTLPQGQWQWTETKGSLEIANATPQSAGFEVCMNIFDTIISVYKDGVSVASGDFQVLSWNGSSCLTDELLEDGFLLYVDSCFSVAVSVATNALLVIPEESVVSYAKDDSGGLFMYLHENSCAGFTYVFRRIE